MREGYRGRGGLSTTWEAGHGIIHHQERKHQQLAALEPNLAVTGHGPAMRGAEMRAALHSLAREFEHIAVPKHGRYVHEPARADATGVTYVPPKET
jgi:hypothetical protein